MIDETIFVDTALKHLSVPEQVSNPQSLHILSHGKSGELFITNEWLNPVDIAAKFKNRLAGKKELYIDGCDGKTSVSPSAILEFPTTSGNKKGIIFPAVVNTASMTSTTPGTIVFDIATLKVKYNAGFWQDLTDFTGVAPVLTPGSDLPNEKVVIGDQNSAADGVLVLDAQDKALILPYIANPASNVNSPVAGMICYDPTKKMMCV